MFGIKIRSEKANATGGTTQRTRTATVASEGQVSARRGREKAKAKPGTTRMVSVTRKG
jgi:hypothetical protein